MNINEQALEEVADLLWMSANMEVGVCAADRRTIGYGNSEALAREVVTAYHAAFTTESLLDTREGLALANTAYKEGASDMLHACNDSGEGVPFIKPASPYSAPLLKMIKAAEAS